MPLNLGGGAMILHPRVPGASSRVVNASRMRHATRLRHASVNAWRRAILIGHIMWEKVMSFMELYGCLAGFRWGIRVNPWHKWIEIITLATLMSFLEVDGCFAGSIWGMGVNPWLKLIGHIILAKMMSYVEFYRFFGGWRWGMKVNPWLKSIKNNAILILLVLWPPWTLGWIQIR